MVSINNLIDTYLEHQLLNMLPITSGDDIELVARMTALTLQNNLPEYTTPILVREMLFQAHNRNWRLARGLLWNTYFSMDITVPIQVIGVCREETSFVRFTEQLDKVVQ